MDFGRLLDRPLRAPAPCIDLLAGVLADHPAGDLGLVAQLLDVPGQFLTLFAAHRWHADGDRPRVQGVGVQPGLAEGLHDGRDVRRVEWRDDDPVAPAHDAGHIAEILHAVLQRRPLCS